MKRKLLFAAIMAVMGVGQSFAYDTTDLAAAGWTKVESLTALENVDDNYYVIVDAESNGGFAMVNGFGGNEFYYQVTANPNVVDGEVFVFEKNGDYINIKSPLDGRYINTGTYGWDFNFSTSKSTADFIPELLNDGIWTLASKTCVDRNDSYRYMGPWDGNLNALPGAEGYTRFAFNKEGKDDVTHTFYIYSMSRSDYATAHAAAINYSAKGWKQVTDAAELAIEGNRYIVVEGRAAEFLMSNSNRSRPTFTAYNDPLLNTNQLWIMAIDNNKYTFKNVGSDTYLRTYDSGWDTGFSGSLDGDNTRYTLTLSDGRWTIQRTNDYLYSWRGGNDRPYEKAYIAGNKSTSDGEPWYIYAMPAAVTTYATALPATGDMVANTWYFFDIAIASDTYAATAMTLDDIECVSLATGAEVTLTETGNNLAATRYYVKSSSDNNLKVATASYSYSIDAATASPASGMVASGQTITVNFNAATNEPGATPTVDFSGVTFGGNAVDVTTSGTGFTFEVPASITYDTDYELYIPAGAVAYTGHESSAEATFTYHTPYFADGTYYMRITATNYEDKYIARGGKWATRAYVEDYGLAVNLTLNDGKYSIQCFDNERWFGDDGEVYTDCNGNRVRYFTAEKVEGGFKFKRADDAYLAVNNDGVVIANGGSDDATIVWVLETPAVYTASCYARNAQKQVVAAATAAGLTGITTGADLEAAFNNSMPITIPDINRQEKYNQEAPETEAGTPRDLLAEQTVTGLADGVYKLSFKGMQRAASYERVDAAQGARGLIYAYANDAKTQLVSVMEEGATTAYDGNYASTRTGLNYPNSESATYAAFDAGKYNNEIYVYVTGGTLTFGIKNPSRTPDNGASWAVFGDFTLTYFSNSYSYLIGDATASPASGSIIKAGQNITVNFNAQTNHPSATPTVDFSGVTFGGNAATVTPSGTGFTFTVPNDVTANTIYKLVIPEGAVQYAGEASSAETTLTYGTAVNSGIYLLYNAKTGKYLAPSGNDIYVTDKGEPISWVVNNDGNSPIKFIETNKYVNGRWWANPSDDARDFVLIVSDEPSLEGFKLKKTNPEDNSNGEYYEYLYISGERVAANGRYQDKENPDNFNDWAYAVWQFVPLTDITIDEGIDYTPSETWANVELIRNIKANTWNTFVVPFDITNDELKDIFGDEVAVAEFSDEGESENAVTVNFTKMATPAIVANTPVLLKQSNSGNTFEFDNKLIKTGEAKVEGTYFDFLGTYAAETTIAEGNYFINSNLLYKSTGATIIKGTRAYLQDKSGASNVKFFIDDLETAIDGLTPDPSLSTLGEIYNLAGQRVSKAQKGIYIQNGKKALIK